MEVQLQWNRLKNFATSKNLTVNYIDRGEDYFTWVIYDGIYVYSSINKSAVANSEQTDFESYKETQ